MFLISGLDVFNLFELKNNLTDSTVGNTGETGDINTLLCLLKLTAIQLIFHAYFLLFRLDLLYIKSMTS